MRGDETYDEIRRAVQLFWEEILELYTQYIRKLRDFCEETKSKVVLEYLAECEKTCNARIGQLWRNEWDDWVHGSLSFVRVMRTYLCGEDAEDTARFEQNQIAMILEDYNSFDYASGFPEYAGVFTEEMYEQMRHQTNTLISDVEEVFAALQNKARWISDDGSLLGRSFESLVNDVLRVVLSVAEFFAQRLLERVNLIAELDNIFVDDAENKHYIVSFNPVTGYVEIQLNGDKKSFTVNDAPLSSAIVEQILAMERDFDEADAFRRELELQFESLI